MGVKRREVFLFVRHNFREGSIKWEIYQLLYNLKVVKY